MSAVSSFLGGIFFTATLLLIDTRSSLDVQVLSIDFFGYFNGILTAFYFIAIPLVLSAITFIFSAIRFAGVCSSENEREFNLGALPAYKIFKIGFLSLLISLSAILLSVDVWIGLIGILAIVIVTIYLARN